MLRKETTETIAHHTLCLTGGFLGIYALLIREGTFGSAETSNLILLVVSGLTGTLGELLVRLGAVGCYASGIALAVVGRRYWRPFRMRCLSIAVTTAACLACAWIPGEADPLLALYPVFFATAIQWVAYTQAAGFNSATIFSTNNLRQSVEGLTDYLCTREEKYFRKFAFYGATLLCFHLGVALGWWCVQRWGIPSVLACLPLLGGGLAVTVWDERTK